MSALIFVDTNVLVYARDAGQAKKQTLAAEWLTRLWRDQTGRISAQVLSEYYVTLTRKLKPGIANDDAWDDVQAFMSWEPQQIDRQLLSQAREVERRYHISWWDSMIVAAAQLQSCTQLLSEDLQDGMSFDQVTVRNPFNMKVEENRAKYQSPLMPLGRHPSRGRPAKKRLVAAL